MTEGEMVGWHHQLKGRIEGKRKGKQDEKIYLESEKADNFSSVEQTLSLVLPALAPSPHFSVCLFASDYLWSPPFWNAMDQSTVR